MGGRVIPFRRPARPPEPPESVDAFEEIARVRDQAEALVVRGLLEAHGVRVLLRTHVAPSVHPFTVGDQGEVRVLVPRPSAAESRLLLTRFAPGAALAERISPERAPPPTTPSL